MDYYTAAALGSP